MLRRHPLPRSAPPAPSDTTSAAPIRRPWHTSAWQATVERSRSNCHKCPFPRCGHAGTTSFCSGISPVDASRAPRPAGGPEPLRPGRRRLWQPACHRPATGRRRRTPHSRAPHEPPVPATETPTTPTAAAGPGLATYRVQLAHPNAPRISRSRHPTSTSSRSSSAEPTCRTVYSAAPNSSRCRSAASTSAVVAARNPPPSSTSIANSPRPRPSTRQRRSGILPSRPIVTAAA